MATIYVTGHRKPGMDPIASALGYAELKGLLLDPRPATYRPRLGSVYAESAWALERSGAPGAGAPPPHHAPGTGPYQLGLSPTTTTRPVRWGWPWPRPTPT